MLEYICRRIQVHMHWIVTHTFTPCTQWPKKRDLLKICHHACILNFTSIKHKILTRLRRHGLSWETLQLERRSRSKTCRRFTASFKAYDILSSFANIWARFHKNSARGNAGNCHNAWSCAITRNVDDVIAQTAVFGSAKTNACWEIEVQVMRVHN